MSKNFIDTAKRNSLLITGGTNLKIQKYMVHQIPYYAITSKKDSVNKIDDALASFFTSYFPALRTFWKDYNSRYYNINTVLLHSTGNENGGFACGP